MGFAAPAAVLIVLTASVYGGSVLVDAWFTSAASARTAEGSAEDRLLERRETVLTVTNVTHTPAGGGNASRVVVHVTNEGAHVLHPGFVTVLVDGVVADDRITSRDVDAAAFETHVWGPGETLRVTVSPQGDPPQFVSVIAGNGATARWAATG